MRKNFKLLLVLLMGSLLLNCSSTNHLSTDLDIEGRLAEENNENLAEIAEKIYFNETSGRRELLVHWNDQEEFASLGIGHFIWYPENFDGPFTESFPGLIESYKEKGYTLPSLFADNVDCPWDTKDEYLAAKDTREVQEAISFLERNKEVQVEYMKKRLEASLEEMVSYSDRPEHTKEQFYRMWNSYGGVYPLIDYVNFKGEGINPRERYNGHGWGLMQVLEEMEGTEEGSVALDEFIESAKYVLNRRIANSPSHRKEDRWREGWFVRLDSYNDN